MFADERRDGPVENHAEALRIDVPAHDVQRIGPSVLAVHLDGCNARFVGPQHASCGPIAEQRGGTIFALVKRSSRKAIVQISTATRSTTLPGRDCARREAIEKPETPPAQPRPNTGTRSTSARKPTWVAARASRLGVAIPVDEIVTTVSTSAASIPAASRALFAASTNSWQAPSR